MNPNQQGSMALIVVDKPKLEPNWRYKPLLSTRERKAYQAAHRILALTEYGERALACPGARRSRQVDRIAQIILEGV